MTPEQIRNQCEDDADRAPSDLTVWRDRGEIIAAQQTRIAQLETEFEQQVAHIDRLAQRIDSAYSLAAWFEAQPNWNEWGIHRQIREALS